VTSLPLLLLLAAGDAAASPGYDALVELGVAQGRDGRLDEAQRTLDRAVALDPRAAAAWRERGGLHFLRREYAEAARDFRRAWRLERDAYSTRMLGNALHLLGRHEDALEAWNRAGMPSVREIHIQGLEELPPSMVRRELRVSEGDLLTARGMRETRLRLDETDAFSRFSFRPALQEGGSADLEIVAGERRGFGPRAAFLVTTGGYALASKVRLRYDNLWPGVTPAVEYKWESTQPRLRGFLNWARPLGLDLNLRLEGVVFTRPSYDLDGPLRMDAHGIDLAVRRVLGPATVAELGFRTRTRDFTEPRPDAQDGRWTGLEGALEHGLLGGRHQVDALARGFHTAGALGSDLSYGTVQAAVRYRGLVAGDDGTVMPGSMVACRVLGGWGTSGTPLDAMFAPGAGSEMDYPLRGHRQKIDGVLGAEPIGRRLALVNVEWRQRLFRVTRWSASLGAVAFYDGGRIEGTTQGIDQTIHDVGLGVRLRIGAAMLRADYGASLTGDGKNALTFGFGQVF
jgi:hypothetical protein